jgi:diguanylate cyclase (GGDEF)-like protein
MAVTMMRDNSLSLNLPDGKRKGPVLSEIINSQNVKDLLNGFSRTTHFTFHLFMEDGRHIFSTRENPLCHFLKIGPHPDIDCPHSCMKSMKDTLLTGEPIVYKCNAMVINFSFQLERFGQKVIVTGRGGFAEYGDLIEFLKICKSNNLIDIPVETPLNFLGRDYALNVASSLSQSLNCILDGFVERNELEVKLKRLTSLLDNSTIETLSKNKELMYIYILDTIEFILGHTSTAMMVLEKLTSTYKTIYTTGRHKDLLKDFTLTAQNPVINEILKSRSSVYPVDSSRLSPDKGLGDIEFIYLFPIFIAEEIEGLICIFDRRLTTEDIRIIKAFRDYIQVTLENQGLRLSINKKSEEILSSLLDISKSIAPLLDTEHLFQTILDKSVQLLNAEQGSLMILDHNTSELLVEARKGITDAVRAKMRLKKGEGVAGKVIESGRPLLVEDIERHPLVRHSNRPHYKTKSFISMPIKIEDRVEGVINITDKTDGRAFNEYDLKLLESFTASAAIAIQRSLFYKQTESLKELSITDSLTGLYNRRHINERLKEEINRFKRYDHPFSFLMIDIDNFKAYNDTHGHIKGDQVLKALADTIASSLRTIDIAGRFGGDEFVVILSQTPKVDAISIASRLKEKVNNKLSTFHVDDSFKKMTISMGLTTFPDDTSSLEEVLERTDEVLYLAKKGGGNRVSHL